MVPMVRLYSVGGNGSNGAGNRTKSPPNQNGAGSANSAGSANLASLVNGQTSAQAPAPAKRKSRAVQFEEMPAPRKGIPPPKRPSPMVPVEKKGAFRSLLDKLFGNRSLAAAKLRQDRLEGLEKTQLKMLNTARATNILYWYCVDLSFMHSDFERLLPPSELRISESPLSFEMTRARNPVNLTKWMGYFLRFDSSEDAIVYYKETLGSELCGMPLKLRFVDESIRGLSSPLLDKVPGLSRRCHALILGLPHGFSETAILRSLWDYDLLNDDKLSIERLPVDKVRYGGSPFLLRFKSEDEAERFVLDHDKQVFPYSGARVYCEVVD